MAKLSTDAAWEFADAIKQVIQPKYQKRRATVQSVDKDGTIWVQLPGSNMVTPVQTTGANVSPGDVVTTELRGTNLCITENRTDPAIGETKGRSITREIVKPVSQVANSAKTIADEANKVATATGQHFWDDDNGAHVTEVTRNEWNEAVADDFSDYNATTKPYHNLLMNSLGILLRTALNNLVSITQSAIAFFDGDGNASSNIVASFGSSGAQIGKSGSLHIGLTQADMELVNDTGDTVFSITEDSSTTIAHSATLAAYASSSAVSVTSYSVSDALTVAGDTQVTVDVGGDTYTLGSTYATVTVTAGTGLTVAITSAGATYVSGLLDAADSGGTLSVEYQAAHYDKAALDMTGTIASDGEGDIVTVTNSGWSSGNQTDTFIKARNETSGKAVSFGVGGGGVNRGIWDWFLSKWLIYADAANLYLNGGKLKVTDNGFSRNGDFHIVTNNKHTSYPNVTNWRFLLTNWGNVRVDSSTDNGSNWTTNRYLVGSDSSVRIKSGVTTTMSCPGNMATTQNVFFGTTFVSAPHVVVGFYSTSTASAFGGLACAVQNIDTVKCTVVVFNNTSSTREPQIEWIAVGS